MIEGKVIAVTRADEGQAEVSRIISEMGGIPFNIPVVEFEGTGCAGAVRVLVGDIMEGRVDYLVFLSWNGFRYMLDAAGDGRSEAIAAIREKTVVAAVGPATAGMIMKAGVEVGVTAENSMAEGIAHALAGRGIAGKRIAVIRNEAGGGGLGGMLSGAGAQVTEIATYRTVAPKFCGALGQFIEKASVGGIDAVVFGSPLAAANMVGMMSGSVGRERARGILGGMVIAAIGRSTEAKLAELGLRADVVPDKPGFRNVIAMLAGRL